MSRRRAPQMGVELLRLSEAQLEYHKGMAAHLEQLTAALRKTAVVPDTPAAPATPQPHAAPLPPTPADSTPAAEASSAAAPSAEEDEIVD